MKQPHELGPRPAEFILDLTCHLVGRFPYFDGSLAALGLYPAVAPARVRRARCLGPALAMFSAFLPARRACRPGLAGPLDRFLSALMLSR